MTWHEVPCFYFSPHGPSSGALFVLLSITKTPPYTGNSHSDKLSINRTSILQCTLFWVTGNTDFFTGATNLY